METSHEYRQLVKLPPILLFRPDLFDLERVLKSDLNPSKIDFSVVVSDGAKRVTAKSVETLLSNRLPEKTNSIKFDVTSWNADRDIDVSISLTLYHSFADCHLRTYSEPLFLGKLSQIERFFYEHKPWYSTLSRLVPIVAPALVVGSLFLGAQMFRDRAYVAAILSGLLFLSSLTLGWFSFQNKIFPFVMVFFRERKAIPSMLEIATVLINALLLLATIAGVMKGAAVTTSESPNKSLQRPLPTQKTGGQRR